MNDQLRKYKWRKQSAGQTCIWFFVEVFPFDPKASLSRALKVTPLKRGLNCNNSYCGAGEIHAREIARRRDVRGKNRDHSQFTDSLVRVCLTLIFHLGLVGKVSHYTTRKLKIFYQWIRIWWRVLSTVHCAAQEKKTTLTWFNSYGPV